MATQQPHLSAEQLAALVEGGLGHIETRTVENHLVQCRECMAAYTDAVQTRDAWLRGPDPRTVGAEWREIGYGRFPSPAVAGKGEDSGPRAGTFGAPGKGRARREAPRRWLVAAVVPLVLMVGVGWLGLRSPAPDGPAAGTLALVSSAVNEASHHGMLLPGSGDAAWAPSTTFRAPAPSDPALVAALDELAAREDNPSRLLRAKGLLASGNLDLARLLTDSARRDRPTDTDWQVLAAVVAYRENDLARAEVLLRDVLEVAPTNVEALFNLGLVFAAGDRADEAERIFVALAADTGHSLASRRAAEELEKLAGRG